MTEVKNQEVGWYNRPRNLTGIEKPNERDVRDHQIAHGEELSALTFWSLIASGGSGIAAILLTVFGFKQDNASMGSLAKFAFLITAGAGAVAGFGYYNRVRINTDESKAIDKSKEATKDIQPLLNKLNNLGKEEAIIKERRDAAVQLGKTNHIDASPALLARLLDKEEDSQVRAYSAGSLGTLRTYGAAKYLIDGLKDPDANVKMLCAYALGCLTSDERKIPEALDPLIQFLNEPKQQPQARRYGISAISNYDDAKAIEQLIKSISDDDKEVRATATASLCNKLKGSYDEKIVKALLDRFESGKEKDQDVLTNLVYSLKYVKDDAKRKELIPKLLKLIKDTSRSTDVGVKLSSAAICALANYESPLIVKPILKLCNDSKLAGISMEAMTHLLSKNKDDINNALLKCLTDKDPEICNIAALYARDLGDKAIQPLIDHGLTNTNAEVRKSTISSLRGICADPSKKDSDVFKKVLGILTQIEKTDKDADVKTEAKNARIDLEKFLTPEQVGDTKSSDGNAKTGDGKDPTPTPKSVKELLAIIAENDLNKSTEREQAAYDLVISYYSNSTEKPNGEVFKLLSHELDNKTVIDGYVLRGMLNAFKDLKNIDANEDKQKDLSNYRDLMVDFLKVHEKEGSTQLLRESIANIETLINHQSDSKGSDEPKTIEDFINILNNENLKKDPKWTNSRADIAHELINLYFCNSEPDNPEVLKTLKQCLAEGGTVAHSIVHRLETFTDEDFQAINKTGSANIWHLSALVDLLDNPANCPGVDKDLITNAQGNLKKILKEYAKAIISQNNPSQFNTPKDQLKAVTNLISDHGEYNNSDYLSQQLRAASYGALVNFAGSPQSGGTGDKDPVIVHDENARLIASKMLSSVNGPEDTSHFNFGSLLASIIKKTDNPEIRKNMMYAVLSQNKPDGRALDMLMICALGRFNDSADIRTSALIVIDGYLKKNFDAREVNEDLIPSISIEPLLRGYKMDESTSKSLLGVVNDPKEDPEVRSGTINLLTKIYQKSQERAASGEESEIREEKICQKSILATLKQCLLEPISGDVIPKAQEAAVDALKKIGTKEAKELLKESADSIKDKSPTLAKMIYGVLV